MDNSAPPRPATTVPTRPSSDLMHYRHKSTRHLGQDTQVTGKVGGEAKEKKKEECILVIFGHSGWQRRSNSDIPGGKLHEKSSGI